VLKDVSAFFAAKVKADDAYAQAIKKLCKDKPGSGMFTKEVALEKETKTLKEAVFAVLEQSIAIADAQLQMSQKVNEQVIKVLDEFAKSKEATKKQLQADGAKAASGVHAKIAHAKKAEQAYQAACKAATAAKDQADKAVAGAGDDAKKKAAAEKLVKKAEEAKQKAKQSEEPYKKAVKEANEERHAYLTTGMPKTLEGFQKLHQERWEQTLSVLKFYTSSLAAMPDAIETAIAALKDKIETQASWDEDLQEFVDHGKEKATAGELDELKVEINELFAGDADNDGASVPAAAAAAVSAATTAVAEVAVAAVAAVAAEAGVGDDNAKNDDNDDDE
jgi:hypothetical protein